MCLWYLTMRTRMTGRLLFLISHMEDDSNIAFLRAESVRVGTGLACDVSEFF